MGPPAFHAAAAVLRSASATLPPDEPLGERVHPRRPDQRLDHPRAVPEKRSSNAVEPDTDLDAEARSAILTAAVAMKAAFIVI
jgi:hypothetical protein